MPSQSSRQSWNWVRNCFPVRWTVLRVQKCSHAASEHSWDLGKFFLKEKEKIQQTSTSTCKTVRVEVSATPVGSCNWEFHRSHSKPWDVIWANFLLSETYIAYWGRNSFNRRAVERQFQQPRHKGPIPWGSNETYPVSGTPAECLLLHLRYCHE